MDETELLIGQSADPDDAFMAWAMASGRLELEGFRFRIRFSDIETLNREAVDGQPALTAISAAAYPEVADRYRMLRAGASFGADYGPLVVAREAPEREGPEAVRGRRVAIPGVRTTAHLLLRIYAGESFEPVPMAFDRIIDAVIAGDVDAGLIIHEGQLVYRDRGLHAAFEPALRWHAEERLPLPLGVVVVRRDLGERDSARLAAVFRQSILMATANPDEALDFAAGYARGVDRGTLREFVDRYVDDATVDMGAEGERALRRLYEHAMAAGVVDAEPPLDLL